MMYKYLLFFVDGRLRVFIAENRNCQLTRIAFLFRFFVSEDIGDHSKPRKPLAKRPAGSSAIQFLLDH